MSSFQTKILAALVLLGALVARAGTDVWFDNFETNAGASWTTNNVWKIGPPTTGPAVNTNGYRTYSGTNCATTGLKGNAPGNADSRLVCTNYNGQPYLYIPAASLYPRLRFEQWFSFANALGFVEVLPAGGTNWQTVGETNISVGGTTSAGGGWTRPALDLRPFAGTNLQVAFHFISGSGGYGNDLGWYVDDVALVTGTPVFNNPENFAGGLGDWVVDNGTWQVGPPKNGPDATPAGSGTNCAGTFLTGNYPWNASTRLISPPFTVPPSNSPALNFWQWYKFVNALGFVEISSALTLTNFSYTTNLLTATNIDFDTNVFNITNQGYPLGYPLTNIVTFTNLDTDMFIYEVTNSLTPALQTNTLTFTNVNTGTNIFIVSNNFVVYSQTNVTIFTNINQFAAYVTTNAALTTNAWQTISPTNISIGSSTLSSGGWVPASLDLSAYTNQTVQVAFHFISGGSGFGAAAGWYVDDVAVVTTPVLTVPSNQTIIAGQTNFTGMAAATNSLMPGAVYRFSFTAPSTNALITTNGVINWTNSSPAFGTNIFSVIAADTNSPPVRVTNSFTVTVLPGYSFSISNPPAGKKSFILALHSRTNLTWQIEASTDLVDWLPVWTNSTAKSGTLLFTDLLATNFPERFYRAVYP